MSFQQIIPEYIWKNELYSIPHIAHVNSFKINHRHRTKVKTIKFLGLWSRERFLTENTESNNRIKMISSKFIKIKNFCSLKFSGQAMNVQVLDWENRFYYLL